MPGTQLLFEIVIGSLHIILFICSIYLLSKIRPFNNKLFMKKRNLTVFYAMNLSIIAQIANNGIVLLALIQFSNPWNPFNVSVAFALWTPITWSWLIWLIIKNWLIFYQYKWTYYVTQSKWQQIINPNVLSDDIFATQNWFISNHDTYGSFKFIFRLCVGAVLCCWLIMIPLNFWAFAYHWNDIEVMALAAAVLLILFCPWTILYVYCVWNVPSLDDAFAIHWESKMHAKILCLATINLQGWTVYLLVTADIYGWIIEIAGLSVFLFLILFVSTYLVPRRVKRNSAPRNDANDDSISLEMVLENEITLNLFMNHLSLELSA